MALGREFDREHPPGVLMYTTRAGSGACGGAADTSYTAGGGVTTCDLIPVISPALYASAAAPTSSATINASAGFGIANEL
jgi:hypothetical protein